MRARTLIAPLFFLVSGLPLFAHASSLISARTGIAAPFIRPTATPVGVNDPQFFVATGTLSDIVLEPVSFRGLSGDESFYLQLFTTGAVITQLDCQTPTRSADDWGITRLARDPSAPPVDFGPFSGNQCGITPALSSADIVYAGIFHTDGSDGLRDVGWNWNGHGFNFSVYAGGLPQPVASTTPAASSVLFLPGTEASRLYVPGPLGKEIRAWEPELPVDVAHLAMNADGTSVEQVYTKDIVDSLYSTALAPGVLEVYRSLENYLDGLVSAGTIKEWRPYPYDWRYDPFDIVSNGTLTVMPDGSLQTVYLADVLKQMASSSPTGQVTIVAHSNGGLVAKALAITLGPDAPTYIDRIILIGTPQFGTPSALGAMLHGDGRTYLGGLIMYGGQVRDEAQNMPGLYDLLPSSTYFSIIGDPVATFATGTLSGLYADAYGPVISPDSLKNFITDSSGIDPQIGSATNTSVPLMLRGDLVDKAAATHAQLDPWTPPSGISLTSIAGWGQKTSSGVAYTTETGDFTCDRAGLFTPANCGFGAHLAHTKILTEDGDGTVVSPSAIGTSGDYWYFDTKDYQHQKLGSINHLNLTTASPIQKAIQDLLQDRAINETDLVNIKPPFALNPLTIISIKSAHRFTAADAAGETGILPVPGISGVSYKKEDVPDSFVDISDDWTTLYLPQSADFTLAANDFVASQTTLSIANMNADGTMASTTVYANIPTTSSTGISLNIINGTTNGPVVDVYGDGSDILSPIGNSSTTLSPVETISLLQTQIQSLSVRPGIKNRLLRSFGAIEAQIDDLSNAQLSIASLEALIEAQAGVGISLEQGASMLQLLSNLEQ